MLSITAFATERASHPIAGSQSIATGNVSSLSEPLPANTRSIRLCADVDCYVALGGEEVEATSDDMYLPADVPMEMAVYVVGTYVAVLQVGGGGVTGELLRPTLTMDELPPPELIAHASLSVGTGVNGGNSLQGNLPNPPTPPTVVGLHDVHFTPSLDVYVGFMIYWGATYDAVAVGVPGTQKPFILDRGVGQGTRQIWQQRNSDDSSLRWLYWANGVDTKYEFITAQIRNFDAGGVNVGTGTISLVQCYLDTGDRFTYLGSDGDPIPGLPIGTEVYAIRVDDDHFQVASTFNNARLGFALPLGGAGTGTHSYRKMDSFPLTGNLQKKFWMEFEANSTERVIRWWATAEDGVFNQVQPTGYDQWLKTGGNVPIWQSLPCVRRLITQTPMFSYTDPYAFWHAGYFENYLHGSVDANTFFRITQCITANDPSLIRAPAGFPRP